MNRVLELWRSPTALCKDVPSLGTTTLRFWISHSSFFVPGFLSTKWHIIFSFAFSSFCAKIPILWCVHVRYACRAVQVKIRILARFRFITMLFLRIHLPLRLFRENWFKRYYFLPFCQLSSKLRICANLKHSKIYYLITWNRLCETWPFWYHVLIVSL